MTDDDVLPPAEELRVLCTGSRNGVCMPHVDYVLRPIKTDPRFQLKLAAGGQRGYDTLVKHWARDNDVPFTEYAVDHKIDGKWPGAGPARNRRMFFDFKPHLVLCFPGGTGTENMFNLAIQPRILPHKVRVLRV